MIVALFLTLAAQSADTGGAGLYQAWCSKCHGVDGRGNAAHQTHLSVRPADLADCKVSSTETEDGWVDVVRDGGAAHGLSLDMPAFGGSATPEQLRAVVRYLRSLCRERGWPPGELNFPRAFLAEKAYPENEAVVSLRGDEQEYIYERRIGRRAQMEASARTVVDSEGRPFDGVTAALKYNVWYSAARRAIASVGIEATPPIGREDLWEVEPYVSVGVSPAAAVAVQGEVSATWQESGGIAGFSYSVGIGREMGRFVPELELGGTLPRGGSGTLSLVPQVRIQLSRLGHVAGSIGVELPVQGPEPRHPRLTAFVLWDYGDAGLFRGW